MDKKSFCPPLDAKFHIGSCDKILTEKNQRKNRRVGGHRPWNKDSPWKSFRAVRSTSLHKIVASRSSTLRQGKLAESRTGLTKQVFCAVQTEPLPNFVTTKTLKLTTGSKRQNTMKFSTSLNNEASATLSSTNDANIGDENKRLNFTRSFDTQE